VCVEDDTARLEWLGRHIVPYEPTARAWLFKHARTLAAADVDDLIQEAYVRLWELDYSNVVHPQAYFLAILRNLMAEQARRAKLIPMERMGGPGALSILSEEPGPEQRASARTELERLRRMLRTLPPQARRAFELRKLDGLTIHETAEVLGVSDSAVEKLQARALVRVLNAMGEAEPGADAGTAYSAERGGTPNSE
jgi:RNA polymerase sigma factor (sigma-70 family)